jgi:hypothetical protein
MAADVADDVARRSPSLTVWTEPEMMVAVTPQGLTETH